jgi:hypothetical protein
LKLGSEADLQRYPSLLSSFKLYIAQPSQTEGIFKFCKYYLQNPTSSPPFDSWPNSGEWDKENQYFGKSENNPDRDPNKDNNRSVPRDGDMVDRPGSVYSIGDTGTADTLYGFAFEWKVDYAANYSGTPRRASHNLWGNPGAFWSDRWRLEGGRIVGCSATVVEGTDLYEYMQYNTIWDYSNGPSLQQALGDTLVPITGKFGCIESVKGITVGGNATISYTDPITNVKVTNSSEPGVLFFSYAGNGAVTLDQFSQIDRLHVARKEFTFLLNYREQIWAFTDDTVYRIQVNDITDPAGSSEVLDSFSGNGCMLKHHAVATPNGVCWFNSSGLWLSDGNSPVNIGTPILSVLQDIYHARAFRHPSWQNFLGGGTPQNGTNLELCFDSSTAEVVLFFRLSNDLNGTRQIRFDLSQQTFRLLSFPTQYISRRLRTITFRKGLTWSAADTGGGNNSLLTWVDPAGVRAPLSANARPMRLSTSDIGDGHNHNTPVSLVVEANKVSSQPSIGNIDLQESTRMHTDIDGVYENSLRDVGGDNGTNTPLESTSSLYKLPLTPFRRLRMHFTFENISLLRSFALTYTKHTRQMR